MHSNDKNRRDFLKKMGITLAAGGAASVFPQMGILSQAIASQQGQFSDYKAIVCLELNGGCDSFNMLIPKDSAGVGSHYDTYLNSRGGLYTNGSGVAYGYNDLLGINSSSAGANGSVVTDGDYGLNPEFGDRPHNNGPIPTPGLQSLYNNGDLAFMANIGSLVEPITKNEFLNDLKQAPRGIGSHSDQRKMWDTGGEYSRKFGWGGSLIGEILDNGSDNAVFPPCISIYGNTMFQTGQVRETLAPISPYAIQSGGAIPLRYFGGNFPKSLALEAVYNANYKSILAREYKKSFNQARNFASVFNELLDQGQGSTASGDGWGRINVPYQCSGLLDPVNNRYPTATVTVGGTDYENRVFNQLQMVARLIKLSRNPDAGINAKRQVYFVSLPDFDTHSTQMANDRFFRLMASISQATGYFSEAMKEIGAENEVTLFSSSEFGRKLSPNGTGTDHGWGGVHFAMGGAVNGGKIYGSYPSLELGADNNAQMDWSYDGGRYIPTTSVEQMMATLSKWMGADNTHLSAIFPNLSNFNVQDLGFMS